MTYDLISRVPVWMLMSVYALIALGMSAIAFADQVVGESDFYTRQLFWAVVGTAAMITMATIHYKRWMPFSYLLFFMTLVLLVLVFFLPSKYGSQRWIPLGPMTLQPSEFAKITYVMALAHYLIYDRSYRKLSGLIIPFVLTGIPVALILKEPDLGTSLLFIPVLFAMLFAAGARWYHLLLLIVLGVMMVPVLWIGMNAEQKSRVTAVFTQKDSGTAPSGDGYHLHQSKRMLAVGGVWGVDLNNPEHEDKLEVHMPASRTDFIFCRIGQRYGLVGCLIMFGLYLALLGNAYRIAASTEEPFGRLLVVGIATLLATQLTINVSMTVGLMPITGITLPLVSYGGSSLLVTLASIGLIINVALRPTFDMLGQTFR
jgi:cell division protein FtsW (lipid II flippase)